MRGARPVGRRPAFALCASLLAGAGVASAQSTPPDPGQGFDLARDVRPRRTAVWAMPVWIFATGPALGRYNAGLGVNLTIADRAELVVEAGLDLGSYNASTGFGGRANYTAFTASVGVALFVYRPRPLNGFFFQPKVFMGAYTSQSNGSGPGMSAGLALEFGYQLTAGPVYFAPVLGFGVGFGVGTDRADRADRGVGWGYFRPGVGFFPAATLAGFRLGVCF